MKALQEKFNSDEGWWVMEWAVAGVPLTPYNFDSVYLPGAPAMPSFRVSHNYSAVPGWYAGFTGYFQPYVPITFDDSSSQFSSYSDDAVGAWTAASSYELSFQRVSSDAKITIFDGHPLPYGAAGITFPATYGWNCIGYYSGACLINALSDVVILYDPYEIATAYAAWTQANYTLDGDAIATTLVEHELGHALGLNDVESDQICSEIRTIMNQGSTKYLCGYYSPTPSDQQSITAGYYGINTAYVTDDVCIWPGVPCQ
jgi:hypothetical protein